MKTVPDTFSCQIGGSPLPSAKDFLGAPLNDVQYVQTPYGGVLYMRTGAQSGVFTQPNTGLLNGTWDGAQKAGFEYGFTQ
jgi:hypothetical protein